LRTVGQAKVDFALFVAVGVDGEADEVGHVALAGRMS
jgi:hypothetical protein